MTIRARQVILSAGALGSATILLRSKVPNDQIGRGAVLHASMPVMGLFDRTIDALSGTQASVFVDDYLVPEGFALEAMSAEPLYAAIMSPGPPRHSFEMLMSYRNLAGFGVMLIDTPSPAESRGAGRERRTADRVHALGGATSSASGEAWRSRCG